MQNRSSRPPKSATFRLRTCSSPTRATSLLSSRIASCASAAQSNGAARSCKLRFPPLFLQPSKRHRATAAGRWPPICLHLLAQHDESARHLLQAAAGRHRNQPHSSRHPDTLWDKSFSRTNSGFSTSSSIPASYCTDQILKGYKQRPKHVRFTR
jgi:hypothetical protein